MIILAVPLLFISMRLHGSESLVITPDDPLGGTVIGGANTAMEGYEFTVGNSPLSVSALGVRDWSGSGLQNSHQVAVWDLAGNLLATMAVTPGASDDGFRYAPLDLPLLLNPGQSYVIAATYANMDPDPFGISRSYENASPIYNPAVTFDATRYGYSTSGLSFPDNMGFPGVDLGTFGPNAEFDLVPEPSATALSIVALIVSSLFASRARFRDAADRVKS